MKRVAVIVLALGAFAFAAQADAHRGHWFWGYPFAEQKLDSEYKTADPWALADAYRELANANAIGDPEAIRQAERHVQDAKRAASVDWAHCRGVGYHQRALYKHFYCTIHLSSWASNWEGTKRVTLHVTGRDGFAVTKGWRYR